MNTDFIPELDHEDFVLQQQHDLGSPDVVSLSEGLSTSDGPTLLMCCIGLSLPFHAMKFKVNHAFFIFLENL